MHISRLNLLLFLTVSLTLLSVVAILFIAPLAAPTATMTSTTVERAGPSWAYPDRNRTPGKNPHITDANNLQRYPQVASKIP
jgi:hypothetical protein